METINSTSTFFFDPEYLDKLATTHQKEYVKAQPYPHIIIDNFLPEWVLEEILKEFPDPQSIDWANFNNPQEKKLGSRSETQFGPFTRQLLYAFNSSIVTAFLEKLTGIEGLIPDPYFLGGGLHQTIKGGYLKVHADFNRHPRLKLDRRLNLLLYLNKDWEESYGGHFEMWDREMKKCHKKVLPIFNRCVVFSTTSYSYHGQPTPLTCPEGWSRKSLALYYYSNGRPQEEITDDHSTLFQMRPGEHWDTTAKKKKTWLPDPIIKLSRRIKKLYRKS